MQVSNGSARPKPNLWVALAGAVLVIALAVGLLLGGGADAQSASAAGYGGGGTPTGNGTPPRNCSSGGYDFTPCPAQVGDLVTDPAKPKKGKGFKVKFTSKSGGSYGVVVTRKGKATTLEAGATGTGKTTTKKVGKKLKAGKYQLRVTINTGARTAAVAKKVLKIVK